MGVMELSDRKIVRESFRLGFVVRTSLCYWFRQAGHLVSKIWNTIHSTQRTAYKALDKPNVIFHKFIVN